MACLSGAIGAAAQEPFVFRSAGDLVRVFVTVTDRNGRLVTTLGQKDFEARDQGKPQPDRAADRDGVVRLFIGAGREAGIRAADLVGAMRTNRACERQNSAPSAFATASRS